MVEVSRAAKLNDSVDGLSRGEALGRYIVIERIGAGANGVVFAAYDPELDRKVALKILRRPEGNAVESRRQERFVREAKATAKLAHPNVVGIFDVGVSDGRVFLAMEYLAGGTLRDWMDAKKRPWREIVKMFVEVGRGLAAAHAEGLVHRDFKPDNVLLDRAGVPKVADFGLARLSGPPEESSQDGPLDEEDAPRPDAPLTRSGTMAGTPAYMAPEQFRGKRTDRRTDQFAFCVTLYEALYGKRPFNEDSVFDLAESVLRSQIQPAPKTANVPSWLRRSLLRGLRADPEQRYSKIEDLLAALQTDPVARMRRVVAVSLAALVVGGTIAGLYGRSERRRVEFEAKVAAKLTDGRRALTDAVLIGGRLSESRRRAFAAFDEGRAEQGETAWTEARGEASNMEATLKRAQASLEAALALDPSNERAREGFGEALFERARLAELEFRTADLARLVEQMQRFDTDRQLSARWTRPGAVDIRTTPPGARLVLERYDLADDGNRLVAVPVGEAMASPSGSRPLPPGSYRVTATKSGFAEAKYPFVVKRGEDAKLDIRLVSAGDVPADFVYVPEGRFLFGDSNEDWRLGFLNAAPIHERVAPAFLIKAHETTFGDWLEFLRDLPADERRLRTPSSVAVQGSIVVRQWADSSWSLELNISGPKVEARENSPIVYPTRRRLASQDWLRMPVLGVSPRDMQAYFSWLSRTGRVPGARFCTEIEWERAARGADGRAYPASQERVSGDDANIDLTYGRVRGSYGPDEVGAHPKSRSPFGVDDLTGNAWEAVAAEGGEALVRGGGYYHSLTSARVTNREGLDRESRSYILGVRVCSATK